LLRWTLVVTLGVLIVVTALMATTGLHWRPLSAGNQYDVYVVKVSPVGAAISLAVEMLLLVAVWRWGRPRRT
jgi:hypothetical protein